ncbi:uncharacterized protein LOC143029445 [Oratosquilla oratoria]|uniref:uncharacterized protein LOC143029445 n=1 Tax=Oratosquilla oratoria TaxID=337810 RepID=UPI003F761040
MVDIVSEDKLQALGEDATDELALSSPGTEDLSLNYQSVEDESLAEGVTPIGMTADTLNSRRSVSAERRSNKPLMEKKRRQRMNTSLNELKNLVLEALKRDPSQYSKLEKADVLEMTVKYVQALHRQEAALRRQCKETNGKYTAGFKHCATEVTRFLTGVKGLPDDLQARLLQHLNSSSTTYTTNSSSSNTNNSNSNNYLHNSVTLAPSTAPIILVVNNSGMPPPTPATTTTFTSLPPPNVPQTLTVGAPPVTTVNAERPQDSFVQNSGNSLGAQPQLTIAPEPVISNTPSATVPQSTNFAPQGVPGMVASAAQPVMPSIKLIPTQLSNGDIAFILPAPATNQSGTNSTTTPSVIKTVTVPLKSDGGVMVDNSVLCASLTRPMNNSAHTKATLDRTFLNALNQGSEVNDSMTKEIESPFCSVSSSTDIQQTSSSYKVSVPATSAASESSLSELQDVSDEYFSCSSLDSPLSCVSMAESPIPTTTSWQEDPAAALDQATPQKTQGNPKDMTTRRSGSRSPLLRKSSPLMSLNFREELGQHHQQPTPSSGNSRLRGTSRTGVDSHEQRRQPLLAPRPIFGYPTGPREGSCQGGSHRYAPHKVVPVVVDDDNPVAINLAVHDRDHQQSEDVWRPWQ